MNRAPIQMKGPVFYRGLATEHRFRAGNLEMLALESTCERSESRKENARRLRVIADVYDRMAESMVLRGVPDLETYEVIP